MSMVFSEAFERCSSYGVDGLDMADIVVKPISNNVFRIYFVAYF